MSRHVSREWMASSARRGVMGVPACIWKRRRSYPPRSKLRFRLGLENLQLFIEATDQDLLLRVRLLFLLRRQLGGILGRRGVDLELEAIQIGIHFAVVAVEIMLRGDHLILGGGIPVGGCLRRARIG